MIRVCPHSDAKCVHGMNCAYTCATDAYDGNKNLMAEQNASRTPAPEGEAVAWRYRQRSGVGAWSVSLEDMSDWPNLICEPLYASPVVPKTADEIKAVVMAWLDADDPASWGDFEKRLNTAVSDDASPVVPVGREEIARIIQDSVWADDATEFTDILHGTDDAADAILAALRPTDTGREG
jgi:hypothetical protein